MTCTRGAASRAGAEASPRQPITEQFPALYLTLPSPPAPDSPPTPFNPMVAVWLMVTRGTVQSRVVWPEYAIDRYATFQRYTAGSAELSWERDRRGIIQPQQPADLVAFRADPLICPTNDLPGLLR